MSAVHVVSREPDRLRFLAYNTCCEILLRQAPPPGFSWSRALETVQEVQQMLDAYDERSELARLRDHKAHCPIRLSDELFNLLQTLLTAGTASSGAFDITVGGLSRLWDFTGSKPHCPDPKRVQGALRRTGQRFLALDAKERTLTFLCQGVNLDAGAAGKGYATARLAETLRAMGLQNASINLGGNLFLLGAGPHDGQWSIGVQEPWKKRGLTLGELRLPGGVGVSTSGGYDRFFIENGQVWHHLLDPRTGFPVTNDLLSCTVVCSDALMCDVLSTALFVGGASCLRQIAQAVCPDAFTGYLLARADGSVEISDSLEAAFIPFFTAEG